MEPQTTNIETEAPPQNHSMGALIGSLIVLAVLVLGGVYFLSNQAQQAPSNIQPVILGDEPQNIPPSQQPVSNSDAVNDISADVAATDLTELEAQIDADLQTIESNL